jgi:signal transduction histidine kinase
VVFIIIALFEGALMFALIKSFDTHLKDKLAIIATQIDPFDLNKEKLLKIQRKYKVFPLYVNITKSTNKKIYSKVKEGFSTNFINVPPISREKVLTYTTFKDGYIIQISTLYSTNDDKIEIIKMISLIISFVIYLITLLIGYKFIDTVVKQIELTFKKLKNFNSNVSHELKTPLTIMKSEIEVALMNEEKDCSKLLKSVLQEINYINEITDKLLFLTKDHLKCKNFQPVDLEELIFTLHEKYGDKINFDLEFGEDDYQIMGDKTLLTMALSNMVENSIKYGAKKIKFVLEKTKNKIILKIIDDGIGIPKEKLPFIFDEFYRVDESHNKKIKGFGLGLSIVKNIMNLHNAKIKVKSERGVEFTIEFPALTKKEDSD